MMSKTLFLQTCPQGPPDILQYYSGAGSKNVERVEIAKFLVEKHSLRSFVVLETTKTGLSIENLLCTLLYSISLRLLM